MLPRRKRILVIAVCLIAALLAAPWVTRLINRTLQPHYEGQPLSFWMDQLAGGRIEDAEWQQATNAVGHMGVAALPFLVKRLKYEQPRWKAMLADPLYRSRLPFADQLYDRIIRRPLQLADATYFGFQALGKRAMPAFDDLCRIMNDSNDQLVAGRAAMALSCLGTDALPHLLEAFANPHHPAHMEALVVFSTMPDVIEATEMAAGGAASFLGITNAQPNQLIAINGLLLQKGLPQVSIPAAAASLVSPNISDRFMVHETPDAFGPQALSTLAKALADPDIKVRRYATNALLQIAPESLTNSPSQ